MEMTGLIEFGGINEEFNMGAPCLVSCQEIEPSDCFENGLKVVLKYREKQYEIIFRNYTLHQIRPEHLTVWDDYEIRRGNYLVIFDKSRLLDYWNQVIIHTDDGTYPVKGTHYGIYTESHLIDIITAEKPTVIELDN